MPTRSCSTDAGAAIYYVPEAFSTGGPKLMGRNAAGESFLRGWFQHAEVGSLAAITPEPAFGPLFTAQANAHRPGTPVTLIAGDRPADWAAAGAVFYSSPGLAKFAWQRQWAGAHAYSLVGITHTTASARVMDAIAEIPVAPLQPWDAVICTSKAVLATVETVLEAQLEFLHDRFGGRRPVLPRFPVIPLGVHCRDFMFGPDARAAARAELGADDDTVVVLFTGRLSFHAKAHPLAMYQALQRAADAVSPRRRVMLVECGWTANDGIMRAFDAAARVACPGIDMRRLDGRIPALRQTAWASADVFCSLSDNIQETFGLVPVEAMAAGLPSIVSDWDGYKDTVRDGIDGFRIPTLSPVPGPFAPLAQMLEFGSYDRYCGEASMLVAVDVAAAEVAFRELIANPNLRRTMGEAARKRAVEVFDWSVIIPAYQRLFAELAVERRSARRVTPRSWPARLDPFRAFAAYPTRAVGPETVLALGDTSPEQTRRLMQLEMVAFASAGRPMPDEVATILHRLAVGPATARDLCAVVPQARQLIVFGGLMQLLKIGAIRALSPAT